VSCIFNPGFRCYLLAVGCNYQHGNYYSAANDIILNRTEGLKPRIPVKQPSDSSFGPQLDCCGYQAVPQVIRFRPDHYPEGVWEIFCMRPIHSKAV
jgi:hypothetical protein